MAMPSLPSIIKNPIGGFTAALLVTLILGSAATAGINTIGMARLMLAASFVISAAFIYRSALTQRMTRREKVLAIGCIALLLFAVERLEARFQPREKAFPLPPLMLLMPVEPLGFLHPLTKVPGMDLAVTQVSRPKGGYAGFSDNEDDDAMLGTPRIKIVNTGRLPTVLTWSLTIQGEGRALTISGNGKGRWERQLNENDWLANNGGKLAWMLSPVTIEPGETVRGSLAFVLPNDDEKLRKLAFENGIGPAYRLTLRLRDNKGRSAALRLPFGQAAVPDPSPEAVRLRELMEKTMSPARP